MLAFLGFMASTATTKKCSEKIDLEFDFGICDGWMSVQRLMDYMQLGTLRLQWRNVLESYAENGKSETGFTKRPSPDYNDWEGYFTASYSLH